MKTQTSTTLKTLATCAIFFLTPLLTHANGPDFSGETLISDHMELVNKYPYLWFKERGDAAHDGWYFRSVDGNMTLGTIYGGYALNAYNSSGHFVFGDSGITPSAPYHFVPPLDNADAQILCDNSSQITTAPRAMFKLLNNGAPRFVLRDSSLSGINQYTFAMNPAGNFTLTRAGVPGAEIVVKRDGVIEMGPGTTTAMRVTTSGVQALSFTTLSDEASKTDIQAIEPNDVLDKISALPVSSWRFKGDHDTKRHIGPMAQDFHEAFGEGNHEATTINLSDMAGVALAGVKSLDQKVEDKVQQKDAEIAALRDALQTEQEKSEQLSQRLDRIEALLQQD